MPNEARVQCDRCNGKGYRIVVMPHHGDRDEQYKEVCDVCHGTGAIAALPASGAGMTEEEQKAVIDLFEAVNSPPDYELAQRVREYRHALFPKVEKVIGIVRRLTTPQPVAAGELPAIEVRDGKWRTKKVTCRQLAEWIAEQATDDREGLIQRVAEAIEEDRKVTREYALRGVSSSERERTLEKLAAEHSEIAHTLCDADCEGRCKRCPAEWAREIAAAIRAKKERA